MSRRRAIAILSAVIVLVVLMAITSLFLLGPSLSVVALSAQAPLLAVFVVIHLRALRRGEETFEPIYQNRRAVYGVVTGAVAAVVVVAVAYLTLR